MRRNNRAVRGESGSTVVNVLLCMVMMVVLAAVLFPMFARNRPSGIASPCQSNLKQIGNAIKMYLSDWQDTYPTNRAYVSGKRLGPVTAYVQLSGTKSAAGNAKSSRFAHGLNWVEGLDQYVEAVVKQGDPASVWKCPAAYEDVFPPESKTAKITYVFNLNLIEKNQQVVRSASSLMLLRESDRLVNAELRPINDSTRASDKPPISPFLTNYDRRIGLTAPKLHGYGSHVLFADGHVKTFDLAYFPHQKDITKAKCWNPVEKQWFNHYYADPKTTVQKIRNMSIQIAPTGPHSATPATRRLSSSLRARAWMGYPM